MRRARALSLSLRNGALLTVAVSLACRPDLDNYLDGNGRKREVTPDLANPPPSSVEVRRQAAVAYTRGLAAYPTGFGVTPGYV